MATDAEQSSAIDRCAKDLDRLINQAATEPMKVHEADTEAAIRKILQALVDEVISRLWGKLGGIFQK